MKKTILFVLPWLAVGGLERMQVTLANALSRRGHSVTVMTLQPGDELRGELDSEVEFIYKPPKQSIGNKIPYIRHKLYDDGMWETRAKPEQLYRYYVGDRKFDVEIGFFRGLSVKIISGSTNPDSVKLAWVHSDFKKCEGVTSNFKNMDATKKAYDAFDKIVCVSDNARKGFEEIIGISGKTVTIYNMMPIESILEKSREKIDISPDKITVLSVGHLIKIKGYDRLLSAAKRLKDDGYDFNLWIVGDGDEKTNLKEYISVNGLENAVLFGQQLNPYKYMKSADLYICSSRYEGYNLTVAEAMICGCPVMSTSCTGPTEILDNGRYGILVDNSEEGLYNGLKSFFDNPKLFTHYKKAAEDRMDFFDEKNILKQIEQLFKK